MVKLLAALESDLTIDRPIGRNWLDEALERIRPQAIDNPLDPPPGETGQRSKGPR